MGIGLVGIGDIETFVSPISLGHALFAHPIERLVDAAIGRGGINAKRGIAIGPAHAGIAVGRLRPGGTGVVGRHPRAPPVDVGTGSTLEHEDRIGGPVGDFLELRRIVLLEAPARVLPLAGVRIVGSARADHLVLDAIHHVVIGIGQIDSHRECGPTADSRRRVRRPGVGAHGNREMGITRRGLGAEVERDFGHGQPQIAVSRHAERGIIGRA